jgi:hypothetical protein
MRRSGTCSEAAHRLRPAAARAAAVALCAAAVLAAAVHPCLAKVFMTQEEALKAAFPAGVAPQRETAFLTDAQAEAVEKASGQPVASRVVTYYKGAGLTAWFDTHLVRTLPETVMVVVNDAGEIVRVDILSFSEPEEYKPRPRWLEQLHGRRLTEDLSLRRDIHGISGATLSARAIVGATRRVLALHGAVQAGPPKKDATP